MAVSERTLTVRLHFSEHECRPEERVFDVKIQGETVLRDFDIHAQAGGLHRALVKEFENIRATNTVVIELVPSSKGGATSAPPIVNAFELIGVSP